MAAVPDYRRRFADQLYPTAKKLEQSTGIPATYSLALAARESGWGGNGQWMGQNPDQSFQELANHVPLEVSKAQDPATFATGLQSSGYAQDDPAFLDHFNQIHDTIRGYNLDGVPAPPVSALIPTTTQIGPTKSQVADEITKLEADTISKIQGQSYLSDTYKAAQGTVARQVFQSGQSTQEVERQLQALRQPDSQDLAHNVLNATEGTHTGSIYTPAKDSQIADAQGALNLATQSKSKSEFMLAFLSAAPSGWASGEWSQDFTTALSQFAEESTRGVGPNAPNNSDQLLQSLTRDDINLLYGAYSELPNTISRGLSDDEGKRVTELLQSRPKPRPVALNSLTKDEIVQSLTGRPTAKFPEGIDEKAYLQWVAKQTDPEVAKELAGDKERWRSLAQQWFTQDQANKIRQAGINDPSKQSISGWDWISLGAMQPMLLTQEALESYARNAYEPLLGLSFGTPTGIGGSYGPLATAGGGALIGAGIGAALGGVGAIPGAGIGAIAGLLYGAVVEPGVSGEVTQKWNAVRGQDSSLSNWRTAQMAYHDAEIGGVNRFLLDVLGDPMNILGSGLVTKALKPITFLHVGQYAGATERGFAKFLDVSSIPLATGFLGSAISGTPLMFLPAAAIGTLARNSALRSFEQLASRSAGEAGLLWMRLARQENRVNTGAATTLAGSARTEDFLSVAKRAIQMIRKDPKPAVVTALHDLGYSLWKTGFKIIQPGSKFEWADLNTLTRALGSTLPREDALLVGHNITDAMNSIGSGFYNRKEIVSRVVAALGEDLNRVVLNPLGKDKTVKALVTQWVGRYEKGAFAEALSPFNRRVDGQALPGADPQRALRDFTDNHKQNMLDIYRSPGYRIAHAEGISGSIQRFVDAGSRVPVVSHLNRMVNDFSRHTLLFLNYGPMNVIENAWRIALGGVNPFPGTLMGKYDNWVATSLDVGHMLDSATPELTNKRPFISALSDHTKTQLPPMAAVPEDTTRTLVGANVVREGKIPGVTRSLPDTFRRGFLGATSPTAANWIEAHVPKQFWSLNNWNQMFNAVSQKQQTYYLYNRWIQALGESHPTEFKQILGALGSLKDHLDTNAPGHGLSDDLLRSIQQKVNTYGLMVDPEVIRAMKMTYADLLNTKLTNTVTKILAKYPNLGELHSRAILNGIRTGELRLGNTAAETATSARSFLERVRLSWWDQSVPGKLEFQSQMLNDIRDQLLTYHPTDGPEIVRLLQLMDSTLKTATESSSKIMESVIQRADEVSGREKDQLHTYSTNALSRLVGSLDDTYKTMATRLIEQIRDPAMKFAPRQQELMLGWLNSQLRDIQNIHRARLAHEQRNTLYQAASAGDKNRVLQEETAKVRTAWDNYYKSHGQEAANQTKLQDELATTLGIPVEPGAISSPVMGTLTPLDVARMYNHLPQALIHNMVDSTNLTLMPKQEFVAKHLARAEDLAKGLGKEAKDFGFHEDSLGEVYDNLLRSASLEPAGATVDTASRSWFKSIQDEIIHNMTVSGLDESVVGHLDRYFDNAADRLQKLRYGGNPGHTTYFHGTNQDFKTFDPAKLDNGAMVGPGIYLTSNPDIASRYTTKNRTELLGNHEAYQELVQEDHRLEAILEDERSTGQAVGDALDRQRRIQARMKQIEDSVVGEGANVRPVDVPDNLNLLTDGNVDEAATKLESVFPGNQETTDAQGNFNWNPDGEPGFVNIRYTGHGDADSARNTTDLWEILTEFLESKNPGLGTEGAAKQAQQILSGMGYHGIQYKGGLRIPIKDANGNPIEHTVKVIFPEHQGLLRNAIGNPPELNHTNWLEARSKAMDEANNSFSKDFPDYTDQNIFDSVMKGFFPFWMYERERFPWLIRSFTKRPWTMLALSKYMENSDEGYVNLPIPGSSIQVNPLRGTAYMGGFRRLMLRDTPEYYDQFPQATTQLLDRAGRVGFYPGIHVQLPLSIFGGSNMQTAELVPNWANTFLGAINQLPIPEQARTTINEQIFPDRFRDFRTIQMVTEFGGDGLHIWGKIQSNSPLTPEEQATWNKARNYVWLVSGTLDAQFGLFRLRSQQKVQVYNALKQVDSALLGVPVSEIDRIQKLQSITGKRLSDIYPMDPLQQWLRTEYLDKYKSFMRPQTTPLLPSALGAQQARIQSYYDELGKVWDRARDTGFTQRTDKGEQTTAKSFKQLDQEFKAGQINPDEYRKQLADTYNQANGAATAISNTDFYRTVPKTRREREQFYQEHGIPQPTWSPGQELQWDYFQLKPEMRPDENGVLSPDYERYFAHVDTLLEAMSPEIRQRFLARIQADWTDTQRLYWQDSRNYLSAYRNLRTVVLQELPQDQQSIVNHFQSADAAEKQNLRQETNDQGQSTVTAFDRALSTTRNSLREANPDLDARLLFWGKTDKVLTPRAEQIYNELLSKYRPGATPISPPDRPAPRPQVQARNLPTRGY